MLACPHGEEVVRVQGRAARQTRSGGTEEVRDMAASKTLADRAKASEEAVRRAAAVNGFSPKVADALVKWRAGGAASNVWLESYTKRARP